MDKLFLEVYKCDTNTKQIEVPLESFIIYFVYKQLKNSTNFQLNLVKTEVQENSLTLNVDEKFNLVTKKPLLATYCVLPLVIYRNVTVVAGLCSVARQLIKSSNDPRNLLGFREACLMACNESSIWTKFCEIDMPQTVKNLISNLNNLIKNNTFFIPEDLTRFEIHLSQPVRIHNVYKVAQDQAKLHNKKSNSITTIIPKEELELKHLYSEGPYMTLSDLLLYPLIDIFVEMIEKDIIKEHLPLIFSWYENMKHQITVLDIKVFKLFVENDVKVFQNDIKKQSLYVSDPKRYKPKNRIFTKQPDIVNALNIINSLAIKIQINEKPFGFEIDFDWLKIPLDANPTGGALPITRMKRKCEQLENLAKAVIKIAKENDVIVDFCSGSGHLGLLLAVQLPKCKIILLENKERSLDRARERVNNLKLNNITLLQCNLDYFIGDFQIGVSLHACGVATDLVIRHCLQRRAAFVCCPCCYGGVHVCHHITYPRSNIFQCSELTLRDYLVLGHSADQTHDAENAKTKQGIHCMNIIDTDRKLQAEEFGYEVFLSKMVPETCTPKNNILVGLPK